MTEHPLTDQQVPIMPSEKEVQQSIEHWIERCTDFLENDERAEISKRIINRAEIETADGEKCPTCPEKMILKPPKKKWKHFLTVEHIVPRCLGGNNTPANLVAMCHHCNQYRNAVMMLLLPKPADLRGSELEPSVKSDLSRFIEWAIRTVHTPDSKRIDAELSQWFAEYSAPSNHAKPTIKKAKKKTKAKAKEKAKEKATKRSKKKQVIASDEILDVLKEILDTQKAILERLQKSPLRRFRDWIFGFFPSKKPRPKIDARLKKHEEKKSRPRRNRRRRISERKEEVVPLDKKKSGPINKYFCPTCNTLFTKWGKAKLHKKETGHGCRVCDDCGDFFTHEKLRQAHEDETGHTNYSGQFFGQKRMSIKHYLPEERLVAIDTLAKNEIDTQGFTKVIEELLGDEEVRCTAFGNRVRRYQQANEWPRLGSKAFLDAFGIPSKTGLVNAIISILGDRVTVIGEDPVTRKIRLNPNQTTPETEFISSSSEPEMPKTKHLEVNQPSTRPDSLPKDVDQAKFINAIMQLVSDEEVSVFYTSTSFIGKIGIRIRKMQETNEWDVVGTRSFLQHYGFPGNFGLLNALITCFDNQIEVRGKHPGQEIRISRKKNSQGNQIGEISESEPESVVPKTKHLEVVDALPKQPLSSPQYILIDGLNNSKGTFRLPRDPHHLGAALIWITENAHLYPTFTEVREQLASKTNLSKSRVHYLLTKIGIIMGGKDWLTTATTSNMDAIVIFDALQTHVYQACLAKQIEVTEQYSEYFSQARNHISGNTEEE